MRHPIELLPIFRERVWGRTSLEPFFSDRELRNTQTSDTVRIGEVWYTFTENPTSEGKILGQILKENPDLLGTGANADDVGICPILVKLLFTTERLSVQVHPDDSYAREHHGCLGKTEAWYVLDSEAGEVAIGFREPISPQRFTSSIANGEIENLLDWRPVDAGDVIFTPAGTVHAIGAGVTICEIQENSDITYRLYDYGRPRELHIDHGVAVSQLGPHTLTDDPKPIGAGREELTACEYFRIERLRPARRITVSPMPQYSILICVNGAKRGHAWFIPASAETVDFEEAGGEWIWTYRAEDASDAINVA